MSRLAYYLAQFRQSWAKRSKDASSRLAKYIAIVIEHAALPADAAILCLGARNRIEPDLWRARGYYDVTAVDLLPSPGVQGFVDMHRLPFPTDRFDLVFASHVIEHAYNPVQACWEIGRVLKRPGWVFAAFPTGFLPNTHDRHDFKSAEGFAGMWIRANWDVVEAAIEWSEDRTGESAVLILSGLGRFVP